MINDGKREELFAIIKAATRCIAVTETVQIVFSANIKKRSSQSRFIHVSDACLNRSAYSKS